MMPGGGRASANEFPEGKGVSGDGPDFFPLAAPAERASSWCMGGGAPMHVWRSLAILLATWSYRPVLASALAPAAAAAAASRRWDYSVVAQGQAFVAPSWLDDELLQALRADLRSLLDAESVPDVDEPIGKRFKLELDTKDWSAPGEAAPSEARAAMRRRLDELRVELEEAVGRPLMLDALGSQVKYTASKLGEPVCPAVLEHAWRSDREPGPPARARSICTWTRGTRRSRGGSTLKPVDTAAALGSSSAPLPFLPQPRARAPPLLLGSRRSPFVVTRQPLKATPRLRICALTRSQVPARLRERPLAHAPWLGLGLGLGLGFGSPYPYP